MYQVGEQVVYGMHGVCCVIEEERKVIDRKAVCYLVLEPVGQAGTRYLVPTHNAAAIEKIHPVLTKEEMDAMLSSPEVKTECWIRDEGQRKQLYRELITAGDRVRLAQMVRTLYAHKQAQLTAGKKVHLCDDNFLRDAEKLLVNEAAIVFSMEQEQAKQYIRCKLKEE